MHRFNRRFASFGSGIATLSLVLTTASSSPTSANPPARDLRTFGVPAQRMQAAPARQLSRGRHRSYVAPTGCSTNYMTAADYFLGVTGGSNVAGGQYDAVLGGSSNEACDPDSAVGAGTQNIVGYNGSAVDSFIGAGYNNVVTGNAAFLGAGNYNEATAASSFVGAGQFASAEAANSFVGAGDFEYGQDNTNPVTGGGNTAGAIDSFVGAGDVNEISSSGTGSFIGAGGSSQAEGGASVANSISGQDSFIGAGDNNKVTAEQAFVGAGTGATVSGAYSAIPGGYGDNVSGVASFAGAGGGNIVSGQDAFAGAGNANTASGEGSFAGAGGTQSGSSGNKASGQDSFAGAGDLNTAAGNLGAVVGGASNYVGGSFAFVGAGYTNAADGEYAAVGGGLGNAADGSTSFIGGGDGSIATGIGSFVGSGEQNNVKGNYASILGGYGNSAKGQYATVAGGYGNAAVAELSFAAGYHADAAEPGSFVWSDYKGGSALLKSTKANQFLARASGGVYFYSNEDATSGVVLTPGSGAWANLSDRNAKTDIAPLDDASVLAKVAALPIDSWQYKSEKGVRHVGPMAQDFYAAFGTGVDNRHITSIDEDGVALAAIKALHSENRLLQRENDALHSSVSRQAATSERENAAKDRSIRMLAEQVRHLDSAVATLLAGDERVTARRSSRSAQTAAGSGARNAPRPKLLNTAR